MPDVDLKTRVLSDLNEARKQRDKERALVLSTLLSELKNREMDSAGDFGVDAALQVVSKAIKQRQDAAEQMRAGGRPELADQEERQAIVLRAYLPEGLSEPEVREIVRGIVAAGAKEMRSVMAELMPKVRGRFDGKEANRIAKEELAGR
jgi:uncharacterized protein YqeY